MTPKQLEVLRYLEDYQGKRGFAPTLQEIGDYFGVTKVTALSHLRQLERGRVIRRSYYRRRAIEIVAPGRGIPVIGRISAGRPIEAVEEPREVDLLSFFRNEKQYFALVVRGDSMIEDGIQDGDMVICERRSQAKNGETVVALLDGGEATLKRFYREGGQVRLQPANKRLDPILTDRVEVQGVVVGVFRKMSS